jgi:LytR_cpsA_psr family
VLGGRQALAYVRARHLPCDHIPDFARIGRQQQFLRAVVNEMLQPSTVARAPSLVRPILSAMRRDRGFRPSDLIYLVGQLRGLSTGAVEFRTVPGVAATIESKSVLRLDPSAQEIFDAIRDGRPLGTAGTKLVNTPPAEANTVVAVVDANSGGTAGEVEAVLADAGFDVEPGIWTPEEAALGASRAAIVHRPTAGARAQVVAAYVPDLPLVPSTELRGAHVAIVVDPAYRFVAPGETPLPSTGCPGLA